ncbi:hypothetical protein HPB47_000110 [Ixodes persulcatus]|uniref:Uncharacterized protein n=1 Tax=Ixodes persulcatus TaxID=34615 RepID=A0AC60PSQ7_IXOPE|nr:hypothetical protein HPB47_000110 [Ixodes persulcatus]
MTGSDACSLSATGENADETIQKAVSAGAMLLRGDVKPSGTNPSEGQYKYREIVTSNTSIATSQPKEIRTKKNLSSKSASSQKLLREPLQATLNRQIANAISSASLSLEHMPLQVNMVFDVVPPKVKSGAPLRAVLSAAHVEKSVIVDIKDGHVELDLPALYIDAPDGHHISKNPVNISVNLDVKKESSTSSSISESV